jgi:hypothetical protein
MTVRGYEFKFPETQYMKDPEENPTGSLEDMEKTILYTCNGVPKELIVINEEELNKCFENAEMNDVLVYILSKYNKNMEKPIYLEEPTNKEIFDSVLIPPMNLTTTFDFL